MPEELEATDAEYKLAAEKIGARIRSCRPKQVPEAKILALWDRGEPSPTYILKRGDPLSPGRLGRTRRSLGADRRQDTLRGQAALAGRQEDRTPAGVGALAYARRTTRLTARVMVNRIWKHHFGRGIVKTPGDFGRTGALPTHPELLDWLALEFVRQGWSMKAMHRLMMTSSDLPADLTGDTLHEKGRP